MAPVKTHTVQTVDLRLGVGRSTFRLVLTSTPDGKPDEILLCTGFGGDGAPFTRPEWAGGVIRLPAEILPELLAALTALVEKVKP